MLILVLPAALALPPEPLELADTLVGAWPGAEFGGALAAAGDVDLNGKPDLLVGAPYDDGDGVNRGRAVLYLADRDNSGFAGESWMVTGTTDRGHYGGSLAGGADLDGDGFSDIVVGCSFQCWRVDLYTGGEGGPSQEPDWTVDGSGGTFGHSMDLVGDVDGDGYAELAIGDSYGGEHGVVYLYLGSSDGPGAEPVVLSGDVDQPVGAVVARAGDVDGDGLADVASGAGSDVETPTAVAIYLGSADGMLESPSSSLSYPGAIPGFGVSLGGGGDIDGDGLDDVVVGADGIGDGGQVAGRVLGWPGAPGGPGGPAAWTAVDEEEDTLLGRAVAVAGDVDGDGFADVLAGRPGYEEEARLEGGAVLLMGGPDGMATAPAWQGRSGLSAEDHGDAWIGYGQAVVAVGDIDGDEYADVAIGAPNTGAATYDERTGTVYVYTGTPYDPPEEEPIEDSGLDTGGEPEETGCGCAGAPALAAAWPLALALLAGRRRRSPT